MVVGHAVVVQVRDITTSDGCAKDVTVYVAVGRGSVKVEAGITLVLATAGRLAAARKAHATRKVRRQCGASVVS